MNSDSEISVNRWRLILGSLSDKQLSFSGSAEEVATYTDMEQLLDYLYRRAQGEDVRTEERSGGLGASVISAAEWITQVRTLFPKKTAEIMEKHALEEFHMTELLTDQEVLRKITPDMALLKTILQLKHLMRGEVLDTARSIAHQVAEELRQKLENGVKRAIIGKIDRNSSSPVHSARNLDITKTIRRNLKHYDSQSQTLRLKDIYFSNRIRKYNSKRVILAIDESGSMISSIIYSAVMAQIIASLPFADLKLVIFDTSVVDLSEHTDDPAQILMSVQLGGGTNIGKAAAYCEQLIDTPFQTAVILVTDLYEGAQEQYLLNTSRNIIASGAKLSFLTALDEQANPAFDRTLGQKLADMGAFVGAMTPEQLGDHLGRLFG